MSEPELPAPRQSEARGVILLADDEEAVRWLGRRYLEADGWVVLEARDGEEALEIIGSHQGSLRLVVTDLNMPKVSGQELAEVLSIFRPGLPVLGISGFLSAVSHDRRLPILPKPLPRQSAPGGPDGVRIVGAAPSASAGESPPGAASARAHAGRHAGESSRGGSDASHAGGLGSRGCVRTYGKEDGPCWIRTNDRRIMRSTASSSSRAREGC